MKRVFFALVAFFTFAQLSLAAVNINTATQAELATLKTIGPAKAKAIVDYRTANGPFKSVDDLANVKGIKGKTLDKIRADVSVSGTTSAPAAAAKAATPATPTPPKAAELKAAAKDAAQTKAAEAKTGAADAGKAKAVDALKQSGAQR